MSEALVRAELLEDGTLLSLVLDKPRGNVLTLAMMNELGALLDWHARSRALRMVLISGAGGHFSFGASVAEHQKDVVGTMLPAFHRLARQIASYPVPVAALVEGSCFGGAFELVLCCHLVFAVRGAVFGCPEVRLGVFPPVAAVCFPRRIGTARTLQLITSGELLVAREAERIGLVDRVVPAADLEAVVAAAVAGLTDKSAAALRLTRRAVLEQRDGALLAELARVEALFVGELMATSDAVEGLQAFLQKRKPSWQHR